VVIRAENFLVIKDGNHVAVFADYSGTFKNPMMGIKPTGKSFKYQDVDLFTFNEWSLRLFGTGFDAPNYRAMIYR
jgi:predicted ester cyclase